MKRLSIWGMERTTSKKAARARLLEARAQAAAERARRERENIGDLAEFMVQVAKVDEVDVWLRDRVAKLQAEAEERRRRHKVAAGQALQAMRLRGETNAAIAAQAGVSTTKLRDYLQAATAASGDRTAASKSAGEVPGDRDVSATDVMPTAPTVLGGGQGNGDAPVDAQASTGA